MQPLIETLMTKFPEAVLCVEADTARSEVTVQVAADRILVFLSCSPSSEVAR